MIQIRIYHVSEMQCADNQLSYTYYIYYSVDLYEQKQNDFERDKKGGLLCVISLFNTVSWMCMCQDPCLVAVIYSSALEGRSSIFQAAHY